LGEEGVRGGARVVHGRRRPGRGRDDERAFVQGEQLPREEVRVGRGLSGQERPAPVAFGAAAVAAAGGTLALPRDVSG
jgi:hypothetical protein